MRRFSAAELKALLARLGVDMADAVDVLGEDAGNIRRHDIACFKFLRCVLNSFHRRDLGWIEDEVRRQRRFAITDEKADPAAVALGRLAHAGARPEDILLLIRAIQSDCLSRVAYLLSDDLGRDLGPELGAELDDIHYGFWSAEAGADGSLRPVRHEGALHDEVPALVGYLPEP